MGRSQEKPEALRFAELWAAALPLVQGYLRGVLSDSSARDDVVQEVAAGAFAHFADYDPSRPFATWILSITYRKTIDRWRRSERSPLVTTDPELLESLAHCQGQLAESFSQEREALAECLPKLPGRSAEIIRLHYLEKLSPQRLSERLNTSAANIRQLLSRARLALRECIGRTLQDQR